MALTLFLNLGREKQGLRKAVSKPIKQFKHEILY
jgi:hypothetical protein